jgi:G3E family GTPase
MTKKIDVLLICGFLGAGKTTLVLKLLKMFPKLKIGIIENEFGEVNIDGGIIQQKSQIEVKLIEITNGSIFCSCRHEHLIEALRELSKVPLDLIILESTGIADPSPFKRDIRTVNKLENHMYRYAGSVCVVDGTTFLDMIDMLEAIRRQIIYSDLILLNKVDSVQSYELGRIRSKISNINSRARLELTEFCNFHRSIMLEMFSLSVNPDHNESFNTTENKPLKIKLIAKNPISKPIINDFLEHVEAHILRLKGFLKIGTSEDAIWYYIDGIYNKIIMKEAVPHQKFDDSGKIIVILRKGDPFGEIIKEAWASINLS